MRRVLYILAIFALTAASTAAQYQVDNFDFPNAVKIQTPKIEPSKPERLVQLTSLPLNPSLGGFTTGNSDVD
ncbi:MAG TPA: hypothetical protein VFS90_18240, partial [Pyrinomonadaceae bacterium]|nr:hypothetical protein [Pyrinomonadaceae bacterium]